MAPPLGGWNTYDAVAAMDAEYACILDNLLPGQGGLWVRPGFRTWASGLPGRVGGLLSYRSGAVTRLFAGSGSGLYEVTAPGPVGAPVLTGLSSPRVDGLMVSAAGGQFLFGFNGSDRPAQFDGTSWSAWSGTGVPVSAGWANVFKQQMFVGRADRLSFWYGVPGAIGGAFALFPLQGVAKLGGGVAGMTTWTLDGGQGPDDYAAFFTTEGEVLVYGGTNPSSATTWALKGTFKMPRPLGRRFLRPYGGDVLVLTEAGVHTLRTLLSGVDEATLPSKALTRQVEPTFLELARGRRDLDGWDLVPLTAYGLWVLNAPWGPFDAQQIAFRASSGAPARMVGLAASCWMEAGGRAFFGHAAQGKVMLWGEDNADDGASIASECVTAFSTFEAPGLLKKFGLAEPVLRDATRAAVAIDVLTDWQVPVPDSIVAGPGAPPIQANPPAGVLIWGNGKWGVGKWGGATGKVSRGWRGVRGIGQAGAVRLRLRSQYSRPGWLGTGLVWQGGGPLR